MPIWMAARGNDRQRGLSAGGLLRGSLMPKIAQSVQHLFSCGWHEVIPTGSMMILRIAGIWVERSVTYKRLGRR